MNLYYWNVDPNFGDMVSPLLIEHFLRTEATWSSPAESDIVGIGSVLDVLPQHGWGGLVLGSGKLFRDTAIDLTSAKVLGVRGPLTASEVKMNPRDRANLVLGDPALLASELAPAERWKHGIGIVPHWTDTKLYDVERAKCRSWGWADPLLIDVTQPPSVVMSLIGSCKRIVSSSLHGIIVADSFGIPRRAEHYARQATDKYENTFKWADYGLSINQPVVFGKAQEADVERIERMKVELFEMYREARRVLA